MCKAKGEGLRCAYHARKAYDNALSAYTFAVNYYGDADQATKQRLREARHAYDLTPQGIKKKEQEAEGLLAARSPADIAHREALYREIADLKAEREELLASFGEPVEGEVKDEGAIDPRAVEDPYSVDLTDDDGDPHETVTAATIRHIANSLPAAAFGPPTEAQFVANESFLVSDIAAHPNTPEDLLLKIVAGGNTAQIANVAGNSAATEKVLLACAANDDTAVKQSIAANPSATERVLKAVRGSA